MAAMMALGTLEKLAQSSTGKMIEGKVADKLGIKIAPSSAALTAASVTAPTVPTATTPLWSLGPGRDGRDGKDGKDGKDGTPDIQALHSVLEKNLRLPNVHLPNMSNVHLPHLNLPHVNFPHLSSHLSSSSASKPGGSSDDELTDQFNNLQKLENDKYIALDGLLKSNPSPDNIAQQEAIVNDITAISTLRSKLFDTLLNNASSHSKVNEQMNSNLEDKNKIITLQENDLMIKKSGLEAESQETSNTKRMVDINTYYHKQYAARVKIMKLVVLICFVVIFFIVLMHLGWLPQELVTVIVVITLFAGLVYIGYLINDMYQRSNINFDEYNFPFDSNKFSSQLSNSTKSKDAAASTDRSCLYNSIAAEASTLEDSLSSKATSLESEIEGGTPDPSQSSSSLSSASTSAGGSTDADGTTLPSVKSKLSESFIPLMSRMDRRQFSSNDFRHPAAYDSENNYGKI